VVTADSLSVISYGGGVQSTALLVLAAGGEIPMRTALFANVGDDSEHPATLRYVREVAQPWAASKGVDVVELHRQRRNGETETLFGRLAREGSRSLPIPVRMSNGAPGTRSCTMDFKIDVLAKWQKSHGASEDNPATVAVGISWDERQRCSRRREEDHENIVYPLCARQLTREDCKRIIERAGLPVPPKSACWFCPFHTPAFWARMRRDEPDLFSRACDLEDLLNVRRATLGKDSVWLTRFARPLRDAIPIGQPEFLWEEQDGGGCQSGYCWV
jgi:3'-phosphoadenosine 5'-phosphosulfate sulfotransferase (PAPS reductase)/FAD synthetase